MLFPDRRDNTEEAVEIVSFVHVCQNLSVLPASGGLFAQDWLFPILLEIVLGAQGEKAMLDEKQHKAELESRTHAPRFS